jgi:hypothetical protein
MSVRRALYSFILISLVFLFVLALFSVEDRNENQIANAAALPQSSNPGEPTPQMSISDETCLGCHGQPGLTMTLENGDVLDLYVSGEGHAASIHGKKGYACVQCHTLVGNYPHPAWTAASRRDATLSLNPACYRCHSGQFEKAQDSVHGAALASGNQNAAVCVDCHTAHMVKQLTDPKTGELLPSSHILIPQMCAQCHNSIYQKYATSVHGAALIDENNQDVPTCISCHGVHNIANPTTANFRLNSPKICAECHTDKTLMGKYGISTDVLSTYVADFHGTTVSVFEKQSPDAEVNKAVCYDCHGIHDIARVDDPVSGIQIKENLLVRCKVCHPDATTNFPSAWLSHYIPSAENNSLVYYVELFYKFFIPVVIGGMGFLVALDVGHSLYMKYQKRKKSLPPTPPAQTQGEEVQNG